MEDIKIAERLRRLIAAAEARVLGYGGISTVSLATGVSRRAIHAGIKELDTRLPKESETKHRIRQSGAGRKKATEKDPTLKGDFEKLVEPVTRGNPAQEFP